MHQSCFRSPLIEPDVRISSIPLLNSLLHMHTRNITDPRQHATTQLSEDQLLRKLPSATEMDGLVTAAMEVANTIVNVAIQAYVHPSHGAIGDSGEAERSFRRKAERHSGMIPNTIGA